MAFSCPAASSVRRGSGPEHPTSAATSYATASATPARPGLVQTTVEVLDGAPVLDVAHTTSGCWQLRGPDQHREATANHGATVWPHTSMTPAVASWKHLTACDPSLNQLPGLPRGWTARRDSPTSPWHRSPA